MSHESQGKSNEWYTPKYVFDAMGVHFDLDVASPVNREFCSVPAEKFITQDSLDMEWNGFIWMNPPYGNQKTKFDWINKFLSVENGVALMPDRTSAPWWQYFSQNCDRILFTNKKIKFINEFGEIGESPSNGSTLFSIGEKGVQALTNAEKNGLGNCFCPI